VGITAVNGTSFADTMLGIAGNDRFRGWQGNDLLDGRGGTGDMVDYAANAASEAVAESHRYPKFFILRRV
jgi:Ca2+-binding RTX toxin-like protein